MKRMIAGAAMTAVALMSTGCLAAATPATVRIVNKSGDNIYFQPEADLNYTQINNPDTVITISESPVYYRLLDANGSFHPVFVTPGSNTEISVTSDRVEITGGNEKENRFMRNNLYICRTPDSIKTYSSEWIDYNENEIKRLDKAIDDSGVSPEFAAIHKLYNRYTLLNQRLGGLTISKVFNKEGEDIKTADNFYDFLNSITFDDENILYVPKWFDVVSKALETKESHGLIPVSNDDYMSIYAKEIGNEKIRSHFLISLLAKTLKYNYLTDFERQLPRIKPMITDAAAIAQLPALEAEFARKTKESAHISAGTEMPDFICKDVDGKEYRFSDMRGEYVLVDFWFTGCVPCRAEMPYFDKVAKDFEGKGVKFVSLSVDTGDALYGKWEKMMRTKPHKPGVLSVNLPGGFNSPLMKTLNIKGVPRIMLIDPEGKIVESYAKRPSDPKLRQQLESLTNQH